MGTALKMNLAEKSSSFKTWNKEHHQPGNSLHTSNWEQKPYSRHLMSAIHNWSLWSQLPCEELRCGAYLSDGGWGGLGRFHLELKSLKHAHVFDAFYLWCCFYIFHLLTLHTTVTGWPFDPGGGTTTAYDSWQKPGLCRIKISFTEMQYSCTFLDRFF